MRAKCLLILGIIGAAAPSARGQPAPLPFHVEPRQIHSDVHSGKQAVPRAAFTQVVQVPGAAWLRLHFSHHQLGDRSYLTITSLLDGGRQRLDAKSLAHWHNSSAIFNGDAVVVELNVDPGDENVSFAIDQLSVGEVPDVAVPRSQCGDDDDRTATTDNRTGRISPVGCTGWRISNDAYLTAGHCGPTITDDILEFNVPDSTCNGTTVASDPDDQYPIISQNLFNDGDGAIGNDWAVLGVGPNSNHGQTPLERYGGFFRTSRDDDPVDVRVTGFGTDNVPTGCGNPTFNSGRNSDNQTNQTHVGAYLGEDFQGSSDVVIEYTVDTEGGNSGSPVIVRVGGVTQNYTIGIHTNAGCNPPSAGNTGTGFEHNNLENAIAAFPPGGSEEYVDDGHPHAAALGDGSVHRPFDTVPEAITAVSSGGTIVIVAGTYSNAEGNTFLVGTDGKSMTFLAPVGTVTIGN